MVGASECEVERGGSFGDRSIRALTLRGMSSGVRQRFLVGDKRTFIANLRLIMASCERACRAIKSPLTSSA